MRKGGRIKAGLRAGTRFPAVRTGLGGIDLGSGGPVTPPDDPVAPALNNVTFDGTDTLSMDVSEAGTLFYLADGTAAHTAAEVETGGGYVSGSYAIAMGGNSDVIDLSAVPDGDYYLHIVVKDGAGNYSAVTSLWSQMDSGTPADPPATAAPVYQGASAPLSGNGNVTLAWPAHEPDDVAVVLVEQRDNDAAEPAPAGWEMIADVAAANSRLVAYRARATSAAEADFVLPDPGQHFAAKMLTFRGCRTSGEPIALLGIDEASGTTVSIPSVVTTGALRLVMPVIATGVGEGAGLVLSTPLNNASLDTLTMRVNYTHAFGNDGGLFAATGTLATAGPTGVTAGEFNLATDQATAVFELIP